MLFLAAILVDLFTFQGRKADEHRILQQLMSAKFCLENQLKSADMTKNLLKNLFFINFFKCAHGFVNMSKVIV